jgi:predicted dehydrogenase
MDTILRVGVIGCGNVAQIMHLPYLTEYEHFELVALADVYRPILDAVGDRYQITRRYTDWRELLAQSDIDAVVLAHAGSHAQTIITALDVGKHVFSEKPMTWNLREAREVAARAATSDRILQIGYHKRYDPGYRYAREQVKQMGDIGFGRITVLHPPDEMGHSPHRIRRGNGIYRDGHEDVVSWEEQVRNQLRGLAGGDLAPLVDEALGDRKDNPHLRLAYGILTVSMIHQVYSLFGFLGQPERVISTDVWREGLSIHSVLAYPHDLRVTIDWHFLSHLKDYREEYAFFGNHQRVTLQLPSPYLKNAPSPVIIQGGEGELAWEKRVIVSYDEAFRNELLAFYDNIVNHKAPETGVEEAVQHMALIQQMIDAVRV